MAFFWDQWEIIFFLWDKKLHSTCPKAVHKATFKAENPCKPLMMADARFTTEACTNILPPQGMMEGQ